MPVPRRLAALLLLAACGADSTGRADPTVVVTGPLTGDASATTDAPGTSPTTSTGGAPGTGGSDTTVSTTGPTTTEDQASTTHIGTTTDISTTAGLSTTTDSSATDTSTTADGTTGTTGEPAPPIDACAEMMPACPATPPVKAGGGLIEIDRCAFPLVDQDTWAAQAGRVAALAQVLPTIALADLADGEFNRSAVPIQNVPGGVASVAQAFRWDNEDNTKIWWIPQGLTGSADASADGLVGGRKLLLVSWYHDEAKDLNNATTKGVRVSVVDIDDPAKPRYRHILLVEPIDGDPVSFKPIPVHAGGLAWFGDYLYVVDTGKGFRVFDMRALMRVDTAEESVGYDPATQKYYAGVYKYVLPQVGAYTHASACAPLFSSVALDRSSDPPTLVSSEYCNDSACGGALKGRIYRWPLDPASERLAAPTVWPLAAHYMAQSHVQGGLVAAGNVYLSSSAPAGTTGALYVLPGGGSNQTVTWVDSPEDLMRADGLLWGLSEGAGARVVFAVPLAKLPG